MSSALSRHLSAIWFITLVGIASCSTPPTPQPSAWSEVVALLPSDGATIDIMELAASSRHQELTRKFKDAMQAEPDWFRVHIKNSKAGQPLPYDPKLGMSEAEYQEMLDLGNKVKYAKVKSASLSVQRNGNIVEFNGGTDLLHLTPVKLNLETDSVKTPFGTAAERSRIEASDGQMATGAWAGIQWKLVETSGETNKHTAIAFALGKLKESGRGILYYDVKKTDGALKNRVSYVLQYDLQPTR